LKLSLIKGIAIKVYEYVWTGIFIIQISIGSQ